MIENIRFSLFGLPVDQHKDFLVPFNILFRDNKFSQIIDLGTGSGIFAILLGIYGIFNNCKVYSFDIKPWSYQKLLEPLGINFEMADVLNNVETVKKITDIIKSDGQTLVLCDNGNKIREFNYYSNFLKPGDVIMAHDYCTDRSTFKKAKYWGWCEVILQDIEETMRRNNLYFYLYNNFLKVAWLCTKKEDERKI